MFLTLSKLLSMGTFKNYVGSRFPSFDSPPLPLVRPCSFSTPLLPPPPPPKVRLLWLELTLFPSISMLVKFRVKKLIMSTSIFG